MHHKDMNFITTLSELHVVGEAAVEALSAPQVPDPTFRAEIEIRTLTEVSQRAAEVARNLGVSAVRNGLISRVKMGELLGVHHATAARWVLQDEKSGEGQS